MGKRRERRLPCCFRARRMYRTRNQIWRVILLRDFQSPARHARNGKCASGRICPLLPPPRQPQQEADGKRHRIADRRLAFHSAWRRGCHDWKPRLFEVASFRVTRISICIIPGFTYSYSALAVRVLVLENTTSSTSPISLSTSTSTRESRNSATSKFPLGSRLTAKVSG
jgi:hypothetical protein